LGQSLPVSRLIERGSFALEG